MNLSMILHLAAIGLLLVALSICVWMLAQDKKLIGKLTEIEKQYGLEGNADE